MINKIVFLSIFCVNHIYASIQSHEIQNFEESQKVKNRNEKTDRSVVENQTFWQWNHSSGSYKIHYIEKGAGPRHVVLIHGFGSYSYTWSYLIDVLAQAGYHVWAMDFIGFGLSDKPARADYGFDLFVSQIDAFMKAKNITTASLIGNSMGGGLALAMAIYHQRCVESIVLIDPFVYPMKLPSYFVLAKHLGRWCKPFLGRGAIKSILHKVMYNPKKISEEQINAYEFPLTLPGGKDSFIRTLQNFHQQVLMKITTHLKDIRVPILIIWGEKDQLISLHYHERMVQAFPKAIDVVIPNCGHIPQEECPQQVSEAILHFYKKTSLVE